MAATRPRPQRISGSADAGNTTTTHMTHRDWLPRSDTTETPRQRRGEHLDADDAASREHLLSLTADDLHGLITEATQAATTTEEKRS